MIAVGQLWDAVLRANRVKTADIRRVVRDECNKAYYELCSMTSWVGLRKQITLDFADAVDETGFWLPSDLIDIDDVRDETNHVLYLPRDEASLEYDDETPRWFYSDVVSSPLIVSNDGLNVEQNASSFTFDTALSQDCEDEYLRINGQLGFYKLTSGSTTQPTFEPTYRGDNLSNVGYQIRPDGTRKLALVDESRTAADKEVTVFYYAYPPTLDQEDQIIRLPSARPLELLTLTRIIGTYNKRELSADRYRGEFQVELDKMFNKNPAFGGPNWGRDRRGKPFRVGRNAAFTNTRPR